MNPFKSLKISDDIWFFPPRQWIGEFKNRRQRIRVQLMQMYLYGGKRAKYSWLNRWYGTGDGVSRGAIRWIGTALFGLQTIISKDFTWLIIFYSCYIPITGILGFLYFWYDVQGIESFASLIIDPFAYQVRKKLGIKDSDGA